MKRIKSVNGYAIYQATTQRDADILQYLEDKSPAGEIKRALRLLIEMQKDREA